MAHIDFREVCVDFPIYNASTRSLKKRLLQVATGGRLKSDHSSVVVRAIDELTLKLVNGDRLGLLGHNGSGKSTCLRLMSNVYFPSQGYASVKGVVGSLIDLSLGIDPEASGLQNIYIRGALLGLSKREIEQHLNAIIDFTELGNFIDMPVRTYSSGMQLRLAFAVSTISKPDILLMDEWLSVGDEGFKLKVEQRLDNLIGTTKIMVLASHDRQVIEKNCNRVLWLEHGKVKMLGEPKEILDAYFGAYVTPVSLDDDLSESQ